MLYIYLYKPLVLCRDHKESPISLITYLQHEISTRLSRYIHGNQDRTITLEIQSATTNSLSM